MKIALLASSFVFVMQPVTAQLTSAGGASVMLAPVSTRSDIGSVNETRDRQGNMQRTADQTDSGHRTSTVRAKNTQLVPKQQVINGFARCSWAQVPDRVRAVLAAPIESPAELKAIRSVASYESCTDRPYISGHSGEFRGALAEAGIQRDTERKARIAALAPKAAVRVAISKGRIFVASFAECIAGSNPAGSLALLETEVGSPGESDAMLAMGNDMSDCMPEGAIYRDVRNHIADALYRMSGVTGA